MHYALCDGIFLSVFSPSTVYCMWMCHGGDIRAMPTDLFMIWLLISFTGTWESASQIGLRALLCAHVLVRVTEKERNRVHFNMHMHAPVCVCICAYTSCVCVCTGTCECNYICVWGFIFCQGGNRDKLCLWQRVFGPVKVDLMMIACNRVMIELSDNNRKSLCNGQKLAVGADTNLFSSIGCGEECRRRCLVSVVGDRFVSQCVCLLVCVFIWFIAMYLLVHVWQ